MVLTSLFKIVHNRNSLPEKSKSGHDFVEDAKEKAAGKVQWGRDVLCARRQHAARSTRHRRSATSDIQHARTRHVAHSKRQVASSESSKEHATKAEQTSNKEKNSARSKSTSAGPQKPDPNWPGPWKSDSYHPNSWKSSSSHLSLQKPSSKTTQIYGSQPESAPTQIEPTLPTLVASTQPT